MLPFYKPDEINNYSLIYDNMLKEVLTGVFGESYNLWKHTVIENRDNKEELEKLGWNYRYSPITEEGILKSKKVFDINFNLDYVLVEDVQEVIGSLTHAPVFIAITGNNSLMAKGIKLVTNSKYSHSSLSFHENLDRLYSFGTDLSGKFGFAIENLHDTYKRNPKFDSDLKLYCILIPKEQVKRMKFKLDIMIANKEKLSYSRIGVLGYLLHKDIEIPDKMFCSQFIDSMFKMVDLDLTGKPSGLVAPSDLSAIKEDKKSIFKLYEGKISKYNPDKLKIKIKSAI